MLTLTTSKSNADQLILNDSVPMSNVMSSFFESDAEMRIVDSKTSPSLRVASRIEAQMCVRPGVDVRLDRIISCEAESAEKDLRKYPENPYLMNNLALIYLNNKESDRASSLLERSVAINPNFRAARLNLAKAYLMANKLDLALDIYNALQKENSRDIVPRIAISDIYVKRGEFSEAKKALLTAIEIDSDNIAVRNRLALVYLVENNHRAAISELRECLRLNSNLPAIYNNLGIAYGYAGQLKKSIDALKAALIISPRYKNAVINLSVSLRASGQIEEAFRMLEQYLSQNDSLEIKEILARVSLETGRHKKALALLNECLLDPNIENETGRIQNNIAVVYHSMREYVRAERYYLECLSKDKLDKSIPIENFIDLYHDIGESAKEKKLINLLLEKFGETEVSAYYLARFYLDSGDINKARELLEDTVGKGSKYPPAMIVLSNIYAEYDQNYDRAIELGRKALDAHPQNVAVINNLAYAYLMKGDLGNARDILKRADIFKDNLYILATKGLLAIKEGAILDGSKLYNLAKAAARDKDLKNLIEQKKNLELGRYYMGIGDVVSARHHLNKATGFKSKKVIYISQARLLLSKLD